MTSSIAKYDVFITATIANGEQCESLYCGLRKYCTYIRNPSALNRDRCVSVMGVLKMFENELHNSIPGVQCVSCITGFKFNGGDMPLYMRIVYECDGGVDKVVSVFGDAKSDDEQQRFSAYDILCTAITRVLHCTAKSITNRVRTNSIKAGKVAWCYATTAIINNSNEHVYSTYANMSLAREFGPRVTVDANDDPLALLLYNKRMKYYPASCTELGANLQTAQAKDLREQHGIKEIADVRLTLDEVRQNTTRDGDTTYTSKYITVAIQHTAIDRLLNCLHGIDDEIITAACEYAHTNDKHGRRLLVPFRSFKHHNPPHGPCNLANIAHIKASNTDCNDFDTLEMYIYLLEYTLEYIWKYKQKMSSEATTTKQ